MPAPPVDRGVDEQSLPLPFGQPSNAGQIDQHGSRDPLLLVEIDDLVVEHPLLTEDVEIAPGIEAPESVHPAKPDECGGQEASDYLDSTSCQLTRAADVPAARGP